MFEHSPHAVTPHAPYELHRTDRVVHAVGPFEMTEYVGIAFVYIALIITARRRAAEP